MLYIDVDMLYIVVYVAYTVVYSIKSVEMLQTYLDWSEESA